VNSYQESYELALRIGNQPLAASCAFNLGQAYDSDMFTLRDLAQAEQWYRRSLELTLENDRLQQSKTQGQFGLVAYERFKEARQAGEPEAVLLEHLNAALQAYQQALDMTPPDAVDSLAVKHNQLGNIYDEVPGQTEQAVTHYREAIRFFEQAGALYNAAITRENVALAYAQAGRFADALLFARAALANFEQFGPAAADRVERARGLVAKYEQAARGGGA
jgi:tetratricopeptide (TPR) repeat protein